MGKRAGEESVPASSQVLGNHPRLRDVLSNFFPGEACRCLAFSPAQTFPKDQYKLKISKLTMDSDFCLNANCPLIIFHFVRIF